MFRDPLKIKGFLIYIVPLLMIMMQVSRNILPRREAFEVLYHLNCDNLCSDFVEDLSFKFSLGFNCLMQR